MQKWIMICSLVIFLTTDNRVQAADLTDKLSRSIEHSTIEVIINLLEQKVDLEAKNMVGNTPLHVACWAERPDIVKLLLERKAEVNNKACGDTPLLMNMNYFNPEIMQLLLEHNADIYEQDAHRYVQTNNEQTALHIASRLPLHCSSNLKVCQLLIDSDPAGKKKFYKDVSCFVPFPEVIIDIIADYALQGKNIINQRDGKGQTALHYAIQANNTELARMLLHHKADPTITDKAHKNAFDVARSEKTLPEVKELVLSYER